MGGTPSALNVTNSVTKSIIEAMTEITQEAGGGYQSVNHADFQGCDIGNNFNLNQSNILKVNADITQSITNDADFQSSLDEKISQIADAEMQGMGFDSPEARNFLTKVTDLSTSISTTIASSCTLDGLQSNVMKCKNTSFGNDTYITQENLGDFYLKCVQDSSSVTEAKQELESFISQESSAKATSVIIYIIIGIALLIVLLIIGAVVFKKLKADGTI